MVVFWDLPKALGEEQPEERSCGGAGWEQAAAVTHGSLAELRVGRAGGEFPRFLQRTSSAVGGLAAAGPLPVTHRRLSQREGPRTALVLLVLLPFLLEAFLLPRCTRPTIILGPYSLLLGASFLLPPSSSSSSLLGRFREREAAGRAGQALRRHGELLAGTKGALHFPRVRISSGKAPTAA